MKCRCLSVKGFPNLQTHIKSDFGNLLLCFTSSNCEETFRWLDNLHRFFFEVLEVESHAINLGTKNCGKQQIEKDKFILFFPIKKRKSRQVRKRQGSIRQNPQIIKEGYKMRSGCRKNVNRTSEAIHLSKFES